MTHLYKVIALCLISLLALPSLAAVPAAAEKEIRQEIVAWFAAMEKAFNDLDEEASMALLHNPSYRLAHGKLATVDESTARKRLQKTKKLLESTDWAYTRFELIDFIHTSAQKVHVSVTFSRYREDDSHIGSWTSLYILTKEDDRWGLKFRSSWAPLTGSN